MPNKLYQIKEGKYPIGSTFYDSNGNAKYNYTTNGLVYDGTTTKVVYEEVALVKDSICPEGYDAVTVPSDGLLFIGSTKSTSGTDGLTGINHTHTWQNDRYLGSSGISGVVIGTTGMSTETDSYNYIKYKLCVSNNKRRGFCE